MYSLLKNCSFIDEYGILSDVQQKITKKDIICKLNKGKDYFEELNSIFVPISIMSKISFQNVSVIKKCITLRFMANKWQKILQF